MSSSAEHRRRGLDALVYAFDANLTLARIGAPERFNEVKERRDKAIEEALDEWQLAADLARTEGRPKSGT